MADERRTFEVSLVTPEGAAYEGECEMLIVPGACRARMPISPAAPGTISISHSPSYAAPSGVTSETSNFGCSSATRLDS